MSTKPTYEELEKQVVDLQKTISSSTQLIEEKLKEALEFNKLVIKTSPIGTLVFHESGQCIVANPAAARIAGASKEQLLQFNFREMESYRKNGILADIEKVLETGEGIQRAVLVVNAFGEDVWFDGDVTCFEINSKKHVLVMFQDVSETKLLEEQIIQQNAEYQAIFNSITDATVFVDTNRHIVRINPAFKTIFGYDFEDIKGQTTQFLYVNDDDYFQTGKTRYNKNYKETKPVYEVEYNRKDGTVFPSETLGVPAVDSSGETLGFFGIIRDVTERKRIEAAIKENEARYMALFNSINNGVAIYKAVDDGNDFILLNINDAAEKISGVINEEVRGKRLLDVFPNMAKVGFVEVLQKVYASGIPVAIPEFYYKDEHREGWRKNYVYKLPTDEVVAIYEDITERKLFEKEQKKLQDQLQQAQKMEAIGTLAGGIAHDFNNILAAVLGYAEMVHETCPADSLTAKDAEQIIIAGNRAKDLVQQILAFSRQAETERILIQPVIIVQELLKLLRATLPTTIDIKQDIDVKTGLILADPTQLHQLLINICTNAFHAMEETGGILALSVKRISLSKQDIRKVKNVVPGDFVKFIIKDSGPGISPEIKARIFEPYFTTKTVGKGTGMGLAIAHGIISSYGGFILCDSVMGEGTTFDIFLPVAGDHAEVEEKSVEVFSADGNNQHILFVDDEESLVQMTQTMLERLGYRVTARNSSLEALTTFKNEPDTFDLVITDQTMPGMSGFDLARRMLQVKPQIPIILCTGYSSVISEEKAKSAGIKGFAMKPLAKKDLATLITKVLDGE